MTDFRAPPIQQPDDPGVVVILRRDVRTAAYVLCGVAFILGLAAGMLL